MKEAGGISIGSSKRNHNTVVELLGEQVHMWRIGTDGDMKKAIALIGQIDGTVDAIGLGGIGLRIDAADRTYYYRDGKRFGAAAVKTPIVCGAGLKGIVERDTPRFMVEELGLKLEGKTVGIVSAVDRYGLSEGFREHGCIMTYGDLPFALGVPILIHEHEALVTMIHNLCPLAIQLPFKMLYPTTSDHTTKPKSADGVFKEFYQNKILAGDWKFIKERMPPDMRGKWIVTNTTTKNDVELLRLTGAELLITTTPRLEGRSFGTNITEAALIALDGSGKELSEERYLELKRAIGWKPDVIWLQH